MKPHASPPYTCLLGAQIPYSDDFQDVELPDFTTNSSYEPTEHQQAAMDAFVSSLDLMHAAKDDDGGTKALKIAFVLLLLPPPPFHPTLILFFFLCMPRGVALHRINHA
jgi:hypothetical protein